MYLGPLYYDNALNCLLVYLAIPETRMLCTKSKICLFYLYTTAKSEIQICSNEHETGLVFYISPQQYMLWPVVTHWNPVIGAFKMSFQ